MQKSKKQVLVLLVLIFTMPGMCAYWFYKHPTWLAGKGTNKGQLLTPPVLIHRLPQTSKWGVLLWNEGPCENACWQQLHKITQIRLALGRRFYNVNLWFLTDDAKILALPKATDLLHKQRISSLLVKREAGVELLGKQSRVFIVSPQNYLVLTYPFEVNSADIYEDLQRVMNLQRN